jgi:hypothetical protein
MKIFSFFTSLSIAFLSACGTVQVSVLQVPTASPPIHPAAPVAITPTPLVSSSPTSSEEITSRISAINSVTIYSGPGDGYMPIGTLEAGANVQVLETGDGNWMRIVCPDGIVDSCWVLWDPNAIYLYEGAPTTLNIPDPASLKFETINTETSPDGRWQTLVTKSEAVSLAADNTDPWFFYVELKVASRDNGTIWTPVSEWHAAGLGQEEPPHLFHWSKDGRFLYYTSLAYPDGACVFYDNIGDSLDRLDLTDGSVAALQPPYAQGILAISPDETMIAYLHSETYSYDQHLVVRDLAAYRDDVSEDSVKWQFLLDVAWPSQVSQIVWSTDNTKAVVTVTEFADYCQPPASITDWELNVETGEYVKISETIFPTATP